MQKVARVNRLRKKERKRARKKLERAIGKKKVQILGHACAHAPK